MTLIALLIFLIVGTFGAIMVAGIAGKKPYPSNWPIAHALAGVVGLVLLYFGLEGGEYGTVGWVAFFILAAALGGGGFLFGIVFRGKPRPLIIALLHGSLGLTGIGVLAYAVLIA